MKRNVSIELDGEDIKRALYDFATKNLDLDVKFNINDWRIIHIDPTGAEIFFEEK